MKPSLATILTEPSSIDSTACNLAANCWRWAWQPRRYSRTCAATSIGATPLGLRSNRVTPSSSSSSATCRVITVELIAKDMGRFDEEGYLYIVDRKKDMIISGGENIFPNDIEEILYRHPAAEMAAVVGAPDPKWGEIVVAAVKLKPGSSVDQAELIVHCKAYLSSFKVPKRIDFREQMPMSSFGKILRRDVRKSYWEHQDVKV